MRAGPISYPPEDPRDPYLVPFLAYIIQGMFSKRLIEMLENVLFFFFLVLNFIMSIIIKFDQFLKGLS